MQLDIFGKFLDNRHYFTMKLIGYFTQRFAFEIIIVNFQMEKAYLSIDKYSIVLSILNRYFQ